MTHLFLSPHYDDAVYSCGGTIYQLTQQGAHVTMFTLLSGIPTLPLPDTPVLQDNHMRWQSGENPMQARRSEDERAAKIIGAETRYADFLDCIYRVSESGEALYPSEDSLWGAAHPADTLPQALRDLTLPDDITAIYAPLGVGNHVDHQIVRDWAIELAEKYLVQFYTDYPYLREPEKVAAARQNLAINSKSEDVLLSQDAMSAKIRAMVAYQSQISSFWEDEDAIAPEVQRTFTDATSGRTLERYWILQK